MSVQEGISLFYFIKSLKDHEINFDIVRKVHVQHIYENTCSTPTDL